MRTWDPTLVKERAGVKEQKPVSRKEPVSRSETASPRDGPVKAVLGGGKAISRHPTPDSNRAHSHDLETTPARWSRPPFANGESACPARSPLGQIARRCILMRSPGITISTFVPHRRSEGR